MCEAGAGSPPFFRPGPNPPDTTRPPMPDPHPGSTTTERPRVCVIGAGPSGLASIKNLIEAGIDDVVCFEASDAIGGNWVFRECENHSSVYASTHLITSKKLSQFPGYPMPADYPDFPSHRQVLAYFQAYARDFDLAPFIRFNTRVEHAEPMADGRWTVRVSGPDGREETHTFDALLVCSGHHFAPSPPRYPGSFTGRELHSHSYKYPEPFRNQRVLVVGGGNSACDIAVDICRLASRTAISMRRGYPIFPKLILGKPADSAYRHTRHLPRPIRRLLLTAGLRLSIGRWERYGLQPPDRPLLESHPTLNSDLLLQIRHGRVAPHRGIERLEGESVIFADGRQEEFDTIIWATGYQLTFPFFDKSVVDWEQARRVPLYLKMIPDTVRNLYFIGLVQPLGCIWTLADYQARLAALLIAGRIDRPADIGRRIEQEVATWDSRFEATPRHQTQVDYDDYLASLLAELKTARAA